MIFSKCVCSQDAVLPLALFLTGHRLGRPRARSLALSCGGPPHLPMGSVLFQIRIDLVFINWHTLPFSISLSFHQVPVKPLEYPSQGKSTEQTDLSGCRQTYTLEATEQTTVVLQINYCLFTSIHGWVVWCWQEMGEYKYIQSKWLDA